MYSIAKTLSDLGDRTLVVKTNGGTVVVSKPMEDGWVVADTFTTDGAYPLRLGQSKTQFVPTGGATYEVLA